MNGKDLEMYYQKYSAGSGEEIHHYHHHDTPPNSCCINESRIKILEDFVLKLSAELENCKRVIQEQNKRISDLSFDLIGFKIEHVPTQEN